jgi:hypothetical protein
MPGRMSLSQNLNRSAAGTMIPAAHNQDCFGNPYNGQA